MAALVARLSGLGSWLRSLPRHARPRATAVRFRLKVIEKEFARITSYACLQLSGHASCRNAFPRHPEVRAKRASKDERPQKSEKWARKHRSERLKSR
jgi:hypothetical protein